MVFCVVHFFLPEVVEITVEIAVNVLVVVCVRFTRFLLLSTGNFHFQYSFWIVTMEFQILTWLCARLFLADTRLVDLSGSNFHGHGVGWLLKFSLVEGFFPQACFWASIDTPESDFHWVRNLFTE